MELPEVATDSLWPFSVIVAGDLQGGSALEGGLGGAAVYIFTSRLSRG